MKGSPVSRNFHIRFPSSPLPHVWDWNSGDALPRSWIPARNVTRLRARRASPLQSAMMTSFVPWGTHSSQRCSQVYRESVICTYSGSHRGPVIPSDCPRSLFAHNDAATSLTPCIFTPPQSTVIGNFQASALQQKIIAMRIDCRQQPITRNTINALGTN